MCREYFETIKIVKSESDSKWYKCKERDWKGEKMEKDAFANTKRVLSFYIIIKKKHYIPVVFVCLSVCITF